MRTFPRIFFAGLSLSLCLSGSVMAKSAGQCGGTDMLGELAATEPKIHDKILKEAGQVENADALLWKIEKDGVEPSYLFGTMHLSDKRVTDLPTAAAAALDASRSVLIEVADTSNEAMTAAMIGQSALIFYSDGRTLSDQLSGEEFAKVEAVAASAGMPEGFTKLMRPWLVSTLLSSSDCERKNLASGLKVLDVLIESRAREKNIQVIGLETVEQQLTALAALPESEQLEMLKVGLAYADRRDDMLETVLQMYLKRNMGAAMPFQIALASKAGIGAKSFETFERTLLVERNAGMVAKIRPELDKGRAFVAVGALHLTGKDGIVARLRASGFTVTRAE